MEADEGEQDDRGADAGVQSGVFQLLVRHDLSGVWKRFILSFSLSISPVSDVLLSFYHI